MRRREGIKKQLPGRYDDLAGQLPDISVSILLIVIDDTAKIRLQGCSADQSAIDIRLRQELVAVLRVHGAAVLDADGLSGSLVIDLADRL